MKWSKAHSPAFTTIKIRLEPGESIVAEPGAMITTIGDIEVKTGIKGGGLGSALKRAFLGGESMFMNEYIGGTRGGEIWLAPPLPGDITYVELKGNSISVQDTAFIAYHGNIKVDTAFRGFRGLLAEGEIFWLKISGTGGVWFGSYGGLDEINLNPGEKIIIDNFHAVAIEETVKWKVKKFGGWKTFFLGGEGIVIEATGPGKVFIQSRVLPEFARLLAKFLPTKRD